MRASLLLFLLAAFGTAATADTLALNDGRFFEGKPIEKKADSYVITFKHGTITVPAALVKSFYKSADGGSFVPTTDLEKEKAAKGFVPWKGRWVKIATVERARAKEDAARQKRMSQMKARRFWRNRAIVKTKRFIYQHTLPDDVFQEFKDLFETYYKFFTKYWGFKPASKFGTVTINIYHDEEYFLQVGGMSKGVLGYYMPSERDLHFFYDRQNKAFTIDVMFHEGNHMLTHMINKDRWYPWWIGEGMAEYFGASEWDPVKKTMKLGRLQSMRLAVLHAQIKEGKMLKLKTLLEASRMGAIEYSWTWSFCHFMLHTKKYQKRFKKYFMAVGRDKTLKTEALFSTFRGLPSEVARDSLLRYLKVKDIEALQKEWYAYIKKALSIDNRAELNWGEAGWIMSLYGESGKARKYFKKAIDAGSQEAYVHYGYAELKLRQNMPGIALKYAKKAVELDPLHARAWSLQGQALFRNDNHDKEGLRLLELAHELDPDDQTLWFMLENARQRLRKQKEKEAKDKEVDQGG